MNRTVVHLQRFAGHPPGRGQGATSSTQRSPILPEPGQRTVALPPTEIRTPSISSEFLSASPQCWDTSR